MLKRLLLMLLCVLLFVGPVYAKEQVNFNSKVYNLEKSLKQYYDVLEFNGSARESDPSSVNEESAFFGDLKDSYLARKSTIDRFSNFTELTRDDYWLLRELGALAEKNFYNKYRNSAIKFETTAYKILCDSYIEGLTQQYNAIEEYKNLNTLPAEERKSKEESLAQQYIDGCIMRESVLLELNARYNFDIDVEDLIVFTDFEKMVLDAKAENYSHDLVLSVQQALNAEGYDSGKEDGIIGTNTVFAIYEYQRMNGLTLNGKITDELVESLGV